MRLNNNKVPTTRVWYIP